MDDSQHYQPEKPEAEEIIEYARQLGMDLTRDSDLLWIAEQGLQVGQRHSSTSLPGAVPVPQQQFGALPESSVSVWRIGMRERGELRGNEHGNEREGNDGVCKRGESAYGNKWARRAVAPVQGRGDGPGQVSDREGDVSFGVQVLGQARLAVGLPCGGGCCLKAWLAACRRQCLQTGVFTATRARAATTM